MMHPIRCFLFAAALLAAGGGALAATCRDQAARLAGDYDLQWPKSPATVESRGPTATDRFAPAEEAGEVPPEATQTPAVDKGEGLTAEQRTRMEALLLEAVKAADEGESERCFERLSQAKSIPELP